MKMRGKTDIQHEPVCRILGSAWEVFLGSSTQLKALSWHGWLLPGERQPQESHAVIPFLREAECASAPKVCVQGCTRLSFGGKY